MPVSVFSHAPLPKITRASASSSSLMSLGGFGIDHHHSLHAAARRLVACSSCQASSVRSRFDIHAVRVCRALGSRPEDDLPDWRGALRLGAAKAGHRSRGGHQECAFVEHGVLPTFCGDAGANPPRCKGPLLTQSGHRSRCCGAAQAWACLGPTGAIESTRPDLYLRRQLHPFNHAATALRPLNNPSHIALRIICQPDVVIEYWHCLQFLRIRR